jgi:hypothetical protein
MTEDDYINTLLLRLANLSERERSLFFSSHSMAQNTVNKKTTLCLIIARGHAPVFIIDRGRLSAWSTTFTHSVLERHHKVDKLSIHQTPDKPPFSRVLATSQTMDTTNIYALATAAEARANEAIARRMSTTMHVAARRVPGNLSNVHAIIDAPDSKDDRMPGLSFPRNQLQKVAQPQAREPAAAARAPPNSRRKMNFAEKLYAILADKHLDNIIMWLPSGKSFCILDKERFTNEVLPTYFREVKFESFSRRINRWGFRKMYTTGLKQVTYTHDLFQKDRFDLLKKMNGKPGQAASSEAPGNADADAAKFEAAVTEQVCLEKTLLARPAAAKAQKQERTNVRIQGTNVQMPVEKRFVPFNQGAIGGTFASTAGTNQDTFRFNERPALVGYEQRAMFAPSQLQLEQIQIHEMAMMNRRHYQPMASSTIRGSLFEARPVSYQGAADMNVARQLSTLDNDIAECEEQLAILQRLAELRERRRALGR